MKKLNLRLYRLIKGSKGQVIAVTAVIIVGLLVYTALNMAAINLGNTVDDYYKITRFADLYAQVVKIPITAIKELENKFGIVEAQGRIVMDVPLKASDENERVNVRVISLPNAEERINDIYIKQGEDIRNKTKDIIVIDQFAMARDIQVGDSLKIQIGGRQYTLNVRGIASSPEFIYLMENEQSFLPQPDKFGVIFVSDEFARQSFGYGDSYNEVIIKVEDEEQVNKTKDRLEKELDKYGVKRILEKENQLSNRMIHEELNGLEKASNTVPVIFLSIAAIILGIMISRMVKNDRTSIGVMKALGYNNLQIIFHYTKFSIFIGVLGALIGTILGTVLSGFMTQLYMQFFNIPMLTVNIYYKYIFSAMVLSAIFCMGAGFLGGRRVLRIFPAESMRPEAPKAGRRILLEKAKSVWKKIPFTWKIVVRNVFRNKRRFVFISMGIALTFGMIFFTIHIFYVSLGVFDIHYGQFQKMDYIINFNRPMNKNVIMDLKNIIDVDAIEPKVEFPFETSRGWRNKVVNIIGVKRDTDFYSFLNLEGETINLPEKGIVLSENLAKYLNVSIGENVIIKSFIPHRDDVTIQVKNIIDQKLGINAYMNIDYMTDILLDNEMITGVYINSQDDVKTKLDELKNISSVQSIEDLINTFKEFMNLTLSSIGMLLVFSGILGFAIVYNATIMSIEERTLEFSSLRVMGFSRKELFNIIVRENFIMTILGIIIGIPLGRAMAKAMESVYSTYIYTFTLPISFSSYIYSALATIIFVVLAQLSTLRKIYKLDFMEALKSRIS